MDKLKQKKINNNNRKRGSNFEKRVADYLDMDVVPYSGSNSRYGYGDVRDTIWLGECKNITPDNNKITIKHEWLDKNIERANNVRHISFLAWAEYGKPNKYIILDQDAVNRINLHAYIDVEIKKASVKSVNLILELGEHYWKRIKADSGVIRFKFGEELWYMMSIEFFKYMINHKKLKGDKSAI